MKRVRIKFCGITRIEDARAAVTLGVDALGFVLTSRSRRFAGLERAREIRASLPPFVTAVALFMDDDPEWIEAAVAAVKPDMLQFHGSESAAGCVRFGLPYFKAVSMDTADELTAAMAAHAQAAAFLLDSHAPGEPGGTGRTFDWSRVPRQAARPLILAGGLTCDNVAAAIEAVRPYAVDVSGGIESAPGIKDSEKMRRFVDEVGRACNKSQE